MYETSEAIIYWLKTNIVALLVCLGFFLLNAVLQYMNVKVNFSFYIQRTRLFIVSNVCQCSFKIPLP